MVPYRLRTVRIGLIATAIALVLLALYPAIAPDGSVVSSSWYYAWLGVAAVAAVVVAALPWEELFRRGWGMPALYLWSIGDILIISIEVAITGGSGSELWVVYLLTTTFFAASYPVAGQVVLLGLTAVMYVLAVLVAGDPMVVPVVVRLCGLGLLTLMGSFLSRELMRQMDEHLGQRQAAERHAGILDRVAAASRQLQSHDTDAVLEAVVETVADMGLTWSGIARLDATSRTFTVVHSKGLPGETTREGQPFGTGGPLAELIRSGGAVSSEVGSRDLPDASWEPARGVVIAPIHVRGDIVAVLGGAVLEGEGPVPEEVVEAVELLASLAGRALELAAAFEEERESVERLEQLDRLKRDFLSNVSHELRTPLTVMLGVTELLDGRWDELDDDRKRDLLRRQSDHVTALKRTIDVLLDFSRLEAGRLVAEVVPFDLADLVTGVTGRLGAGFEEHVLEVDTPGRAEVLGDPDLVERVVENLLVNATTHTPAGTAVTVSVVPDGSVVTLAVADDGPGIPAAEVGQLTDRFFRGGDPDTRPTRGLGLGLALSHEILVAHGSKLQVESEVGRGTRFWFVLPVPSLARSGRRARGSASSQRATEESRSE